MRNPHRALAFFHPAIAIDEAAVAQVQTDLRRRILSAFVGRDLLASFEAKEMLGYQHSGSSVDAGVCIQAHNGPPWNGCCATAPAHPLLVNACAKRAQTWCTAAQNNIASLARTSVVPGWTNCISPR